MYNVKDYGAVGNGSADDRAAIEDAIQDIETNYGGVGTLYFPSGQYLLDSQGAYSSICLGLNGSNILFAGEGRGSTQLILGDNVNCHMINFDSTIGGGLRGIQLNGNKANQSVSAHAIRGVGNTKLEISDFYVHDVCGYGIGLQDGTLTDCHIHDGWIEDTGSDGFDSKNMNDDNTGNSFYNVTIRRAGQNTSLTGQTCADFRGPWRVNNVVCEEYINSGTSGVCETGIRFRPGELNDPSGYGGHHSSLTNFFCNPSSTSSTKGVDVSAYQVAVSTGTIIGAGEGISVKQAEATIGQIECIDGQDGFVTYEAGLATNGERCIMTGCIARSNAGIGFKIQSDYVQLNNVVSRSNAGGFNISSAANQTYMTGISSNNSSYSVTNNGTNTHNSLYIQ